MSSRRQRAVFLSVVALAVGISASMAWYKLQGVRPIARTHTVQKGDTLWAIARDNHTTVEALKNANHLKRDTIEVGQELVIPDGGDGAPPAEDAAPRPARTRVSTPPVPAGRAPAPGALAMPAPQPCVAPPALVDEGLELDEATFAASEGIPPAAARQAIRDFLPQMARCLDKIGDSGGTIDLELTVACTGQVAAVEVQRDDGLPAPLVDCVRETARFVPFPAHGLPDGDPIRWPVEITAP